MSSQDAKILSSISTSPHRAAPELMSGVISPNPLILFLLCTLGQKIGCSGIEIQLRRVRE